MMPRIPLPFFRCLPELAAAAAAEEGEVALAAVGDAPGDAFLAPPPPRPPPPPPAAVAAESGDAKAAGVYL